jgi:hypothetical protein
MFSLVEGVFVSLLADQEKSVRRLSVECPSTQATFPNAETRLPIPHHIYPLFNYPIIMYLLQQDFQPCFLR